MKPIAVPRFRALPRDPDIIVVGAGAAGIAAARAIVASGRNVAVLEARERIGGRAVTVALRGHPVDLGAHWLHCGAQNPLIRLGEERGELLRRAPQESHLVSRGRFLPSRRRALDTAFARADHAMTQAAEAPEDRPAAKTLPLLGPWRAPIETVHGLVSGRPLREVSVKDFPSMEYADNRFIAGGYGAYLARLAAGLPIRLGAPVTGIALRAGGVEVETAGGHLSAKAAIVTVPVPLLARGAIRFSPALPDETARALGGFLPGTYEHVVLHWPSSPFRGADRLATLVGTRHAPPGLLTRVDGTPFHYFELDHPLAATLDGRDANAPARLARAVLADQFGSRAIADLSVAAATAWRHDPLSLCAWAVVPSGHFGIRQKLRAPVDARLWFAGEALSSAQWGTVGGAFEEGTRAANEALAALIA